MTLRTVLVPALLLAQPAGLLAPSAGFLAPRTSLPSPATSAQLNTSLDPADHPRKLGQYITFTPEPQLIPANKPATLELRFHVIDTYHVNSHTPASDLLIPTSLELLSAPGVRTGTPQYPAGHPYTVGKGDLAQTLDVYSGDLTLTVPIQATAGQHSTDANLTYQACDRAACYPPKTLKLQIPFTAK